MNRTFSSVQITPGVEGKTLEDLPEILHEEGMFTASQELFWVVSYDPMTNLRACVTIAQGDYYKVAVSIPAILTAVLLSGADRFYVGHNHPSGKVEPTKRDITLTEQIMVAASICGLFLEDHVVLGPSGKWWSMRDKGQLTPSPAIVELIAANGPVRTHTRGSR